MRGRSEATSLARCRAQIQHRGRDGRRIRRWSRSLLCMRALQAYNDLTRADASIWSRHRARNECTFADQDFPHQRDQIVRTKWATISAISAPQSPHAAGPQTTRIIGTDIGTDSHGVSDPSGHARGHFQRAHRGRSRHGFLL